MGSIQDFVAQYSDERLNRLEAIRSLLSTFNPEGEEFDELLVALLPTDAARDSELQHYTHWFKRAFHRWEQRQMGSFEESDGD